MRPRVYSDEKIIAALTDANGMIYRAAKRLKCNARTIYERAEISPAVKAAVKTNREKFVDAAEAGLVEAVERGEGWAVALVLKTLGKDRGYVERQELAGDKDNPLEVNTRVDLSGLTDEQLKLLASSLKD